MITSFPFSESVSNVIAGGDFMLVYAVELDFKDDIVRAHTGTGELIIEGQIYYGIGSFGDISPTSENNEATGPLSVDLTLSGLDNSIFAQTNVRGCRGRPGRLMLAVIGPDGQMAVDILFSGRMDAAQFSFAGNAGDNSITIPLVDRMAEWSRRGVKRWTDESHQQRHPGDRFFFAVAQMSERPIYWGAKKDAPSFRYDP